ncbi:unnamed protein product [Linum trigynum]
MFAAESHKLPALCPLPSTEPVCTTGTEIEHWQQHEVLLKQINDAGCCIVSYYGGFPIYSYSYCRDDNPKAGCKVCLEEAAGIVVQNCNNTHGARYTRPSGSCCIRYENYQFCSP